MKTKNPITGCRPAQLFGLWSIEPEQFRLLYAQAMRCDLVALAQARRADFLEPGDENDDDGDEDDDSPQNSAPYTVEDGIAHLSITGPMTKYSTSFQQVVGGTATLSVRRAVRQARADDAVSGLMFCIDSPGGTVDGTKALADDIADCAADKPCMAFIDGMGCSAAYWCASQCSMVYASPTSLVGSIGTRIRLEDSSKMYEQAGIKVHEITTGPMKAAGADGTPISAEQIDYYQQIAADTQQFFSSAVQARRNLTPQQMAQVSDGRVFIADRAQNANLIDKSASYDMALADLKAAAANAVQSRRTRMWFGQPA